jgi:hypothetical protein
MYSLVIVYYSYVIPPNRNDLVVELNEKILGCPCILDQSKLVIRVFIPHITDKGSALLIPPLKMLPCNTRQT